MDMPPNLRQLQHALLLDAERHFARAAQHANLSTSAFSRSISELEQSLGVKLFDRSLKRVVPTAFGRMLVERGQAVLKDAANLRREIQLLAGLETGTLAVAAGPYAGETTVPRALSAVLRAHPKLQITLALKDPDQVVQDVLAERADVGVADVLGLEQQPRLVVEALPALRTRLACRPGHPLTAAAKVTLDRLLDYPLATIPLRGAAAAAASGAVATAMATERRRKAAFVPQVTMNSLAAASQVAQGSDALFVAPAEFVAADVAAGRLVTLQLDLPVLRTTYGIIQLAGRSLSPAAQVFIDRMREVMAEAQREAAGAPGSRKAPRRR